MNRKVVFFGFSITAMGFVAALTASTGCSSSPAPSHGSSGGSSGGGMGAACPSGPLLIDDMTAPHTTGTSIPGGFWFTFDDRTNPYAEPSVLLRTADGGTLPGYINPSEFDQFPPSSDPKLM